MLLFCIKYLFLLQGLPGERGPTGGPGHKGDTVSFNFSYNRFKNVL